MRPRWDAPLPVLDNGREFLRKSETGNAVGLGETARTDEGKIISFFVGEYQCNWIFFLFFFQNSKLAFYIAEVMMAEV